MTEHKSLSVSDGMQTTVDTFLAKVAQTSAATSSPAGRLIFALDATASRQPTWDTACQLHAEMFREPP
jgi:hypothetical protein